MQVQEVVYQAATEAARQVLHQVLPLLQGSEQQLAQDATMRMLRGFTPAHQVGLDPAALPLPQGLTADAEARPRLHAHADAAAGPPHHGLGALDGDAATLGPMGWPASVEREILATALQAPARTAHKWGLLASRALAWRRKARLLEGRYLCAASRQPHGAQASSATSYILQRSRAWASEFPELCGPGATVWPALRPPPHQQGTRPEGVVPSPLLAQAPGPQLAQALAPGYARAPASQPTPDYYQRVSL